MSLYKSMVFSHLGYCVKEDVAELEEVHINIQQEVQ